MSSTSVAVPTGTGIASWLDAGNGAAQQSSGRTIDTLIASIAAAFASFGIQFLVFALLRLKLSRIYRPKSYLVAERERVPIPPSGPIGWIKPLFTTPDSTIIDKCGLDAYFFLRYLRMLLRIFFPLALLILPILLPLNRYSGGGGQGLDRLGWQNVAPEYTNRLWVHLILSIVVIVWVCYVVYKELRGYIRIRQAYLTSPEHRIRASATTVLVSGIPRKWLTLEALSGLYDVFPGGIRNIWINRNYDELFDKVQQRDKIAKQLESAETALIRKCLKKYKEAEERKAKEEGRQKKTKGERQQERENADARAQRIAQGDGISAGDTHQTPHNVHDVLDEIEEEEHLHRETPEQRRLRNPISLVGQGLDVVGHGFGALGHIGKDFVGGVTQNVDRAIRDVNETFDAANTGRGFVGGDSAYNSTIPHGVSGQGPATISFAQDVKDANPGAQASAESLVQDGPGANTTAENAADEHWRKVEAREREQELQQTPGLTVTDYTPTVSPKVSTHDGTFDEKRSEKNPNKASAESGPKTRQPNRARPNQLKPPAKPWMVWKRNAAPAIPFPSPQPHTAEEEEYPLGNLGPSGDVDADSTNREVTKSKWARTVDKLKFWKKDEEEPIVYPKAYNEEFTTGDQDDDFAVWKKYMETKDRETLREPLVNKTWFPRLPLLGKKIDKIYHLRKELARLNVEIEKDQNESDRFPLMNSAFIQFNHQVAAHMACQSLSHHVPQHMAPRLVEISPTDVIWSNMSIKWWERYIRVAVVLVISAGLVILFGIPVTFTGALSQINSLADEWHWLKWLADLPGAIVSIIQGILPPVLLSLLLTLVPIIFRQLVKQEGVPTGNAQELGIQGYYFFFLFVQVFLVVTLSSGITQFIGSATNLESIPTALAQNLPKASNYFFSYLIIQALSSSAGALLQAVSLLVWFLWAPIVDSTPREKWRRQVSLQNVQWGSFFPPFTNFAVIGLIYSIIAPFILVFNLIIFSLYWIVQRYNILYVYQFRHDTGGLLFPKAINQLFTGLYVLEVCLIGLFFLAQNPKGDQSAYPEAIIMIVVTVFTAIYQFLLNDAFKPLFRYLPITLEDDAVIRDEEFARARKWKTNPAGEQNEEDVQDVLEARERQEEEEEQRAEEEEHKRISQYRRSSRNPSPSVAQSHHDTLRTKPTSTPTSSWKTDRWRTVMDVRDPVTRLGRHLSKRVPGGRGRSTTLSEKPTAGTETDLHTAAVDVEHQRAIGDVLFSGYHDELEDLNPEERDTLVRYSFQHAALRARRPVVWIPRDHLGISDDEIERTKRMSTVDESGKGGGEKKTNIWISNEGTALDGKGRVVYKRSPPDFANVDLIEL